MAFRVKDLLINIAPSEGAERQGIIPRAWGGCGCTGHTTTLYLTLFSLTCWLCPVGVLPGGNPELAAEQLAIIKMQLKLALAEIEKQEKLLEDESQPQTEDEIDELQGKLREALSELDRRKKELRER